MRIWRGWRRRVNERVWDLVATAKIGSQLLWSLAFALHSVYLGLLKEVDSILFSFKDVFIVEYQREIIFLFLFTQLIK
jgi:hypothetical protein